MINFQQFIPQTTTSSTPLQSSGGGLQPYQNVGLGETIGNAADIALGLDPETQERLAKQQQDQKQLRLQKASMDMDLELQERLEGLRQEVGEGAEGYTQKAISVINDHQNKAFEFYADDERDYLMRIRQPRSQSLILQAKEYEITESASLAKNNAEKLVEYNLSKITADELSFTNAIENSEILIDNLSSLSFEQKRSMKDAVSQKAKDAYYKTLVQTDPDKFINQFAPKTSIKQSKTPTPVVGEYADVINANASKFGVDPSLVYSVIKQESNFNPKVVSSAGAVGLGQIMPATAKAPGFGVAPYGQDKDLTDPVENVRFSTEYLSKLLQRYDGDVELALIAYNAGAGNADKFKKNGRNYAALPDRQQTEGYVKNITRSYASLSGQADNNGAGLTTDPVINKYLGIAEKQKIEQVKKQKDALNDRLSAMIVKGDISSGEILQLYNQGKIDDDIFASKYKEAETRENKQKQDTQYLTNYVYAPTDHPDFVKAVDHIYDNSLLPELANPEIASSEKAQLALNFVTQSRGVVAKRLNDTMSRLAKSNQPAQGEVVGNFVMGLKALDDRNSLSQIPDDVRQFGDVYEMHMMTGIAPTEASRLAFEATNPDDKRIELLQKRFDMDLKEQDVDVFNILDEYGDNESWFSDIFSNNKDFSDQDIADPQYYNMAFEFQQKMRDNFTKNGGDIKTAAVLANEQISRYWSRSFDGRFMRYAPEKIYNLPSEKIKADFMLSLEGSQLPDVETDEYHLYSSPMTARQVMRGQKPAYMVMRNGIVVKDKNQNPIYYRPDVEAIKKRDYAKQQADLQSERNTLERQIQEVSEGLGLSRERAIEHLQSLDKANKAIMSVPSKAIKGIVNAKDYAADNATDFLQKTGFIPGGE